MGTSFSFPDLLSSNTAYRANMKILFASSEVHPLMKTGGLADVSGSLPKALRKLRHDCRIVMPAYPEAKQKAGQLEVVATVSVPGVDKPVEILQGYLPGTKLPLYLVDAPAYFDRAGNPYRAPNGGDWQDNHLRFGLFGHIIAALSMDEAGLGWKPDILHCNDWQTGLAPALLHDRHERPAMVFTIHNLAYQGLFPLHAFHELSLPHHLWAPHFMEFHGQFSFIKGGLVFADRITTVSPTYAQEIRTREYGYGLEGLLEYRSNILSGILNGVDDRIWNPATDKNLATNYSAEDLSGKVQNKLALQKAFGLPENANTPIFGHVGRMVEQKGIDLILQVMPEILDKHPVQFIMLGSGERHFEETVQQLSDVFPEQVGIHIGYDEARAHLIEAGSDLFLMPSRFEPCGLNQMYSLIYGTPPVVRRTGGLADTIVDATAETLADGTANGFSFDLASAEALSATIGRALACMAGVQCHKTLVQNGMRQDFSWERSARAYLQLYKEIC
jgi:starch synthase